MTGSVFIVIIWIFPSDFFAIAAEFKPKRRIICKTLKLWTLNKKIKTIGKITINSNKILANLRPILRVIEIHLRTSLSHSQNKSWMSTPNHSYWSNNLPNLTSKCSQANFFLRQKNLGIFLMTKMIKKRCTNTKHQTSSHRSPNLSRTSPLTTRGTIKWNPNFCMLLLKFKMISMTTR